MKSHRQTKRALLTSVMALVMCVVMLVGTTFAWFTDTESTSVNKIEAGKLDVQLMMATAWDSTTGEPTAWDDAEGKTLNFLVNGAVPAQGTQILWEPGCTYKLPELRVVNNGNLALKYKITVNGVTGDAKLLEAIDFTAKMGADDETSLDNLSGAILPSGAAPTPAGEAVGTTEPITIKGVMKTTAGNEYQGLSIDGIGITVVATQYTYEYDSKDNLYDKDADATIQVNKDNIQDYLDGKYGSIDGMTLVLAAGDYDELKLGQPSSYAASGTLFTCPHNDPTDNSGSITFNNAEDYIEHMTTRPHHGGNTRSFSRTIRNLTITAQEGVTVKGLKLISRAYDGERDPFVSSRTGYNVIVNAYNLKFSKITFTGKVEISSQFSNDVIIDGVTFTECTFKTNDTTSTNGQALNYSNSLNNRNIRNLVVDSCIFSNSYQGVYTNNVRGVSVTNCQFNTTGHNAIGIQDNPTAFNHGKVVITGNTFTNIGDRIIRFNKVGADTQITIKNNTATNSGDDDGEVIKATSLADGIKYDISGNNWGENKKVVNRELVDKVNP